MATLYSGKQVESGTYPKERTPPAVGSQAPSKPTTLADYSKSSDNPQALERFKDKGRKKSKELKASKGNKGCQEEFVKFIRQDYLVDNIPTLIPDSLDLKWDNELKINREANKNCSYPSKMILFNTWGLQNIYLISHENSCNANPNKGKEIFNNRIRQVYELMSNNRPSLVHSTLKKGPLKPIKNAQGTIRLRQIAKLDDAYCDQAQWVSPEELHRIIFTKGVIPNEPREKNAYLSTGGLILLLDAYIKRLESLKLIPQVKLRFSPALFLLLHHNLANSLTFPADNSLTLELIKIKMEVVTKQYKDCKHDYYAPMLYRSHWFLPLIKTEPHLYSVHYKDQPIQNPGRIMITFQSMCKKGFINHQPTIPRAIRNFLSNTRGLDTIFIDDPTCQILQASQNPLEIQRMLHLYQDQKVDPNVACIIIPLSSSTPLNQVDVCSQDSKNEPVIKCKPGAREY